MRTFDVYSHPAKGKQAVKSGWSWPGFFFGFIWAFVKGLPFTGIALVLIFIFFRAATLVSTGNKEVSFLCYILELIVAIVVGLLGNNWRRTKIIFKGYRFVDSIKAKNPYNAMDLVYVTENSTATWNCPKCGSKNKNTSFECTDCGFSLK